MPDILFVANFLIHYMDASDARKMISDLSPGPKYLSSCNKAYSLYSLVLSGKAEKPLCW